MDLSKFKTSDWLKVGGGLGFLIFGTFLPWVKVSVEGFGSDSAGNAFDFFFTGTIPWLLIIGAAVVTVLLIQGALKPGQLPWPLILLAATGLGALLVVLRLLIGPGGDDFEGFGVDVGRGAGLFLAAISAIAAAAGGFLGFKESGGDVNDLKDMNKLKGAFNVGGPAAPSGMAPPPPPPPAPPAPPAPPSSPPPPPPPA